MGGSFDPKEMDPTYRKLIQLEERMASDRVAISERFEAIEKRVGKFETELESLRNLPVHHKVPPATDPRGHLPPSVAKALGKEQPPQAPASAEVAPVGATPADEGDVPLEDPAPKTFGVWKSRKWYLLYRGAMSVVGLMGALIAYVMLPQEPTYRFFILGVVGVSVANFILALLKKAPKGSSKKILPSSRMVSDSESDTATTRVPDRETTFRRLMKRGGGDAPRK